MNEFAQNENIDFSAAGVTKMPRRLTFASKRPSLAMLTIKQNGKLLRFAVPVDRQTTESTAIDATAVTMEVTLLS